MSSSRLGTSTSPSDPDTHCRTVPCSAHSARLACLAASHQSVRRLSSAAWFCLPLPPRQGKPLPSAVLYCATPCQYGTATICYAVGMACLEPGMMSSRYLPRRPPRKAVHPPIPCCPTPSSPVTGEVWSRIPRDLHPESEMECLDEVTCRGISCPTKATYKYHILFSSYLPSSQHSFSTLSHC